MNTIKLHKNLDNERIEVRSECTTFCYHRRVELLTLEELLDMLKSFRRLMKSFNIKLKGYNKTRKFIIDNYESYKQEVLNHQATYDQLKENWKDHDIKVGYGSDDYYINNLQALSFKLQKMQYRNTFLSQFESILYEVQDLKSKRDLAEYISVSI